MTARALASRIYTTYATAYAATKGTLVTPWASLGEASKGMWVKAAAEVGSASDDGAFARGVQAGLDAAAHAVKASAQKYSEENKRRVMVGHAAILKVSVQEVTEPAQAA